MSAPSATTIRRQLLNARAYFIPYGETISATAVTASAWPVHTTLTAWQPYQIPDIENVKDAREVVEEKFLIPSDNGGYWNDFEKMLVGLGYEAETSKSTAYIEQLQFALSSAPVVATAQRVGGDNKQQIKGVLLMQYQLKDGSQTHTVKMEAWFSLKSIPGAEGKTNKYGLSFMMQPNTLNDFKLAV